MSEPQFKIDPLMRLPDLLLGAPQARAVLNRYGLHGCGGANGPAESIRFFAHAHGVDEARLLGELRQLAMTPATAEPIAAGPIEIHVDDAIYRRFFTAAIAVVLTAGGTWGAWMLIKIGVARSFTDVSVFEINAHAHAQIFGWVGLFIMGFAYQAFPRKWQTRLVAPRVAVVVFIFMLIGLIAKSISLYAAGPSWAAVAAFWAGTLELLAITAFAIQIYLTFSRSLARFEPWIGFAMASLVFFIGQAAFDVWHSWTTMTAASADQLIWYVSTYQSPLRDMQIHGMAMLMILGVNIRLLPGIYQVPPVPARRAWSALIILLTGIVSEVVFFIAFRWTGNAAAAAALFASWTLLAVGVTMIALPWKLWRPLRDLDGQIDRSGKFIRTAYLWLAVSMGMLLLLPAYLWAAQVPFSHAYFGAIRHAITVGFISLMIMGFSAKVVPTLNGVDPRGLSQLWGPFLLINLGCFLRVTLQTWTDWHPGAFNFVGVSGALEVAALAWWGMGLIGIMRRGKRTARSVDAKPSSAPSFIAANHRIADVLAWFPSSEEVFARHGFASISNPILRNTVAKQVSIAQAAAMRGVDLATLIDDLNTVVTSNRSCDTCCKP